MLVIVDQHLFCQTLADSLENNVLLKKEGIYRPSSDYIGFT